MVNVDEAFEMRYKKHGETFQVLVDFDKLKEFEKKPEETDIYDVLADTKIFKDQKKGELASTNLLEKSFPNKTEDEILKEILLKGECQIPTAYLNKLREEKKLQVITYISENALNAQTKGKFTPTMIESEINKLKFNFEAFKPFEGQADEILKLLKKIMPISLEQVTLLLKIPATYAGNFYGPFRKLGKFKKEFYDNTGSLNLEVKTTESSADKIINFTKQNSNNEAEYQIKKE